MTIYRLGDSEPPSYPSKIQTRSGSLIVCERVPPQSLELVTIRSKELMKWIPNLTLRSASPFPYNCVGMIFASRRTWIEIDYIYDLLHGDDFREIPISTIMVGDLVIYKKSGQPTHVGVIVTIDRSFGLNIQVLSKWGKDGEFIHFINDVPELFGQAQEYWTDRPHETP